MNCFKCCRELQLGSKTCYYCGADQSANLENTENSIDETIDSEAIIVNGGKYFEEHEKGYEESDINGRIDLYYLNLQRVAQGLIDLKLSHDDNHSIFTAIDFDERVVSVLAYVNEAKKLFEEVKEISKSVYEQDKKMLEAFTVKNMILLELSTLYAYINHRLAEKAKGIKYSMNEYANDIGKSDELFNTLNLYTGITRGMYENFVGYRKYGSDYLGILEKEVQEHLGGKAVKSEILKAAIEEKGIRGKRYNVLATAAVIMTLSILFVILVRIIMLPK